MVIATSVKFDNCVEWVKSFTTSVERFDGVAFGFCFLHKRIEGELRQLSDERIQRDILVQLRRTSVGPLFADVVGLFFKALRLQSEEQAAHAVETANQCVTQALELYKANAEDFFVPLILHVATFSRQMADWADGLLLTQEHHFQTKVVNLFRNKIPEMRSKDNQKTPVQVILCNQLMKNMIRADNLQAVAQVLKSVDGQECDKLLEMGLPKGPLVEYSYLAGKVSMWEGRIKEADRKLSFAWRYCHRSYAGNKRLILRSLVAVKGTLGKLPKKGWVASFGLAKHERLLSAVARGDLQAYDAAMDDLQDESLKDGTYLALGALRRLAQKSLCRKVYLWHQKSFVHKSASLKIELSYFTKAFSMSEEEALDSAQVGEYLGSWNSMIGVIR